jgi:uncharacterized protein (TIGR00369 family)
LHANIGSGNNPATTQDERVQNEAMSEALVADGWTLITDDGFIGLIGPFFRRGAGADLQFGFPTDSRHHNLRGVLQGGALMTFADRTMGITARAAAQATRSATVQLNVNFVDAVQIGEMVETRPVVIRVTRQLVFMSATLTVGERIVGIAQGVWKILAVPNG